MSLSDEAFERYRELILKLIGVSLARSRRHFVENRLRPRLRARGCSCFEEYYRVVASGNETEELRCFIDEITTHHTFFFRESSHFDQLADHIEELHRNGRRRFRVWSAACSTGEEPYSLLMTLAERFGDERFQSLDLRVLGTDVSVPVLRKAAAGVYESESLQGVSRERLLKHFQEAGPRRRYEMKPIIRSRVAFRELNLIDGSYPMKGPFDAILCRNVLLYFEPKTQGDLLRRMAALVAPGGLLFVGMTESAMHADLDLRFAGPAVYRREANPLLAQAGGVQGA